MFTINIAQKQIELTGIFEVEFIDFFFFKQKTAYEILTCDWSSDVCSSDLITLQKMITSKQEWLRGLTGL